MTATWASAKPLQRDFYARSASQLVEQRKWSHMSTTIISWSTCMRYTMQSVFAIFSLHTWPGPQHSILIINLSTLVLLPNFALPKLINVQKHRRKGKLRLQQKEQSNNRDRKNATQAAMKGTPAQKEKKYWIQGKRTTFKPQHLHGKDVE